MMSDGAPLTPFGIEFQTEAKENERSPCVALMCAGLMRRGMVYELERVLQVCNGFFCSMSAIYDGAVFCGSGSTNKLFCKCFLL